MNKYPRIDKILIGLLIMISQLIFSQKNNVFVEYSITMSENSENIDLKSDFGKIYIKSIEASKSLLFNLMIKENEEYFCINDSIFNKSISSNFIKNFSGYTSPIYCDRTQNLVLEDHDDKILGKYVLKKQNSSINWEITNETKYIDGFLCHKAIADDNVINSVGTFKYKLTAWFSQSIPISSGPLCIGGLPGLILELNRRNVTFGIKKIKFLDNSEKKLSFIKPNDKKTVSEEEVQKMREDFINSKD